MCHAEAVIYSAGFNINQFTQPKKNGDLLLFVELVVVSVVIFVDGLRIETVNAVCELFQFHNPELV